MERLDAWLSRKRQEIALLRDGLNPPPPLPAPRGLEAAIEAKFRFAALLRAQHARGNWAATESNWHDGAIDCAPFTVNYRYQRFDETVSGPPIYEAMARRGERAFTWTTYAGSGMSAITAVILSLSRAADAANIHMGPGAYFETAHLIRAYFPQLRLLSAGAAISPAAPLPVAANVLLIDSFAPANWFDPAPALKLGPIDLAIFDTTCFAAGSGHIARILAWADREGVPLVLVRSHLKLDMLGIEYGRLGSAMFVLPHGVRRTIAIELFQRLALGARDAIRLTGGAALPVALPPFLAHPAHRAIARRRHARLLANMRRFVAGLREAEITAHALEPFAHGLFCTLAPPGLETRDDTRRLVEPLVAGLREAGVPTRRAGSFGFDFIALDEYSDVWRGREAVRIAMADLPTGTIDTLLHCIVRWAGEHDLMRQSISMPG
jgi:hypothetical protein